MRSSSEIKSTVCIVTIYLAMLITGLYVCKPRECYKYCTSVWHCNPMMYRCVTLCRWPAKQTIPLSVLARNQTKGFGLEISAGPEVVTGREKRVGCEKERTGSWRRDTNRGSRHRTLEQRGESAWHESPVTVREDRVKMSAFQLLCGIFASNPC